jgi:hypothetical protein
VIFFYGWYFLKAILGVVHFLSQHKAMLEGMNFLVLEDVRPLPFFLDTTVSCHQPSF